MQHLWNILEFSRILSQQSTWANRNWFADAHDPPQ